MPIHRNRYLPHTRSRDVPYHPTHPTHNARDECGVPAALFRSNPSFAKRQYSAGLRLGTLYSQPYSWSWLRVGLCDLPDHNYR